MTDVQLDAWARAMQAFLVLEAKIGSQVKYATIFEAKDLATWVSAQLEKGEPFEYWLVTVKSDKLERRHRTYFYECNLLELAESCLTSFERGLGHP